MFVDAGYIGDALHIRIWFSAKLFEGEVEFRYLGKRFARLWFRVRGSPQAGEQSAGFTSDDWVRVIGQKFHRIGVDGLLFQKCAANARVRAGCKRNQAVVAAPLIAFDSLAARLPALSAFAGKVLMPCHLSEAP